MNSLIAQITNPVIDPSIGAGDDGGQAIAIVMANLFRTIVLIGGLALLLYLALGGISWMTAGGDKGKIQEARDKITNAIVGMGFLVAVIAIAAILSEVFNYDLLNPVIPTP